MLNRLVIWFTFSLSPSSKLIPVLPKWLALAAVVAAAVGAVVVAVAVADLLLPTPLLLAIRAAGKKA